MVFRFHRIILAGLAGSLVMAAEAVKSEPTNAPVLSTIPAGQAGSESGGRLSLLEGVHHLMPGSLPVSRVRPELPSVFAPSQPRKKVIRYPWKRNIVTTVFWVGELPTPRNPTPNTASSWDMKWKQSFGGYDDPDPDDRSGWLPKKFVPRQNPFYVALPYNDIRRVSASDSRVVTKDSAREMIPWFDQTFYRNGRTVLKGRWVAIRRGDKVCYGQWEDVGPFETDDWPYVFSDKNPQTKGNGGAGLDVSPAIRDYLGFRGRATVDWRFVELYEVPDGPWKTWGNNNPFARQSEGGTVSESIAMLREIRKKLVEQKTTASPPGRGGEEVGENEEIGEPVE